MDKCVGCINSRAVVSENGIHYICTCSVQKAMRCLTHNNCCFIDKTAPQYPCRNCVYFSACGDNQRRMPCAGRRTKKQQKDEA